MTINTKEDLIQLITYNNIPLEKIVKDRCYVDWDYNAKEKLINPNDLIISVIRDKKLKELGI